MINLLLLLLLTVHVIVVLLHLPPDSHGSGNSESFH